MHDRGKYLIYFYSTSTYMLNQSLREIERERD